MSAKLSVKENGLQFTHMIILNLNLHKCRSGKISNLLGFWRGLMAGFMLLSASSVLAQNLTVNGSLDVLAGPITLGTGQIWDGTGTWDPYNPTLIGADGLTIQFQDTGAWDWGAAGMDIYATFYDPDGSPYSGDEYWGWNDQWGNYQETNSTSIIDHWGNSVDGYTQNPVIVYHEDSTQSSYNLGTGEITFLSAKPDTTFRWQVSQPDGNGSFYPQDVMTLDSTGSLSIGSLHASDVVSSYVSTYYLYAYSGFNSYGNIYSAGTQNTMPSQTLGGGNSSVMTLGLSDARYLRRDSSVSVSGSYAGGIGQNLLSGGTQFVSGKNNVSDTTALFIVGAGSSTSSRKNALSVSSAGNTTVDGTLTVTGATTLSGTLGVTGAATLSNSLTVGGTTTAQALNATSGSFSGNLAVGGSLTVGGEAVLTQAAANSLYLTPSTASATYVSKSASSVAIGNNATAAGGAFAAGDNSIAGAGAISLGTWAGSNGTPASGASSISMGYASHGNGEQSISMGTWNWASANDSISIGPASNTLSQKSVAIGNNLFAYRWGQVVLGTFNTTPANVQSSYTNTAQPTDEIFVIGNGADNDNRSNAFVIKRNGDTEVVGTLKVGGLTASSGSQAENAGSVALGPNAWARGNTGNGVPSVAIGKGAAAGISSTEAGIAPETLAGGTAWGAGEGATAIGLNAYATYYSVAIGDYARATNAGTALGRGSQAAGWASLAAMSGSVSRGESSLAMGTLAKTEPTAFGATVVGYNAGASGQISSAFGADGRAFGLHSMALNGAWAHGENSVGIGPTIHTWGMDQLVVGIYPAGTGVVATERQPTDALFVVGNGEGGTGAAANSNAFVVRRNGNAEVKGGLTVGGHAVLTEEDGAGYALQTGLAAVSDTLTTVNTAVTNLSSSVSSGYVAKSSDSLAIGTNATSAGGAFAIGYESIAAEHAISIGGYAGNNGGPASGSSSISLGSSSHGVGIRSIALGTYNWAGGTDSIVMGHLTVTNTVNSVAIGRHAVADRPGQIVLGAYNAYTADNPSPQAADNLLVIGNGTADNARSNAFIIKRNGDTEVKGSLTVQGQRDPSAPDPTTTTKVIPKNGQMILVPEQGDISMGEFRSGALPVAQ